MLPETYLNGLPSLRNVSLVKSIVNDGTQLVKLTNKANTTSLQINNIFQKIYSMI